MKTEVTRQGFTEVSHIKFKENSYNRPRIVKLVQTDGQSCLTKRSGRVPRNIKSPKHNTETHDVSLLTYEP